MYKIGFDSDKYIGKQSEKIIERVNKFENKLYLEVGGKLVDDLHAARVLPGFNPNSMLQILKTLTDKTEIILAISATDIEKNRMQGDQGITYGDDLLRLLDLLKINNLYVSGIVITKFAYQEPANLFKKRLERVGIPVFVHYMLKDYPMDIKLVMSENGFGKNEYIKTTRPLVVVAASGSSSGKMAVCLSQLYHEMKHGVKAGYAKFEKFPIWNLSLKHPINLAYEASTANINDINIIDPYHLEAYGAVATSYNRDVEGFSILDTIFKEIWGESPYKSPTDMGVNLLKECITDDEICQNAAKQEIIRRYYKTTCEDWIYGSKDSEVEKIELLMQGAGITKYDREVVGLAKSKAEETNTPSVAIKLPNGKIITGKTTPLLGAPSAAIVNALKTLAGLNDSIKLISPAMIEPIQKLSSDYLENNNPQLSTVELLIALAISTVTNPTVEFVLEQIPKLKNSEAHSSVILSNADLQTFHKLGINITCEPEQRL